MRCRAAKAWRGYGISEHVGCAPPHIRRRVSSGRLTCRGTATYVRGRAHSGQPYGRGGHSSRFGGALTVEAARSTPGGRKDGAKKTLCPVTTRGRNARIGHRLRRGLRPRAARPLFGGVSRFHFRCAAPLSLAAFGLPAPDETRALWVLAVALIPAFRHVLPTTTHAQAHPRTWLSPAGLGTWF